ncbi:MAG: hypothetical protein ABR505_12010 [Actinomycetota bacterium]
MLASGGCRGSQSWTSGIGFSLSGGWDCLWWPLLAGLVTSTFAVLTVWLVVRHPDGSGLGPFRPLVKLVLAAMCLSLLASMVAIVAMPLFLPLLWWAFRGGGQWTRGFWLFLAITAGSVAGEGLIGPLMFGAGVSILVSWHRRWTHCHMTTVEFSTQSVASFQLSSRITSLIRDGIPEERK